jgi:DNA-binding response OmpR family regulator
MRSRVLVIEDEGGIRDFVERGLTDYGYEVDTADDGHSGAQKALSGYHDLVVLDVMLPGRSGLSVLEELHRNRPALPVILLTALGETENRIEGLDAGAVDYMVKPFSVAELAARIRAHLRSSSTTQTKLRAADLELDLIQRKVSRAGVPVHLSSTEFALLAYFVQNVGHVLTREQILHAVWEYDHDPGTNSVEVYIGYLRRKLRVDGRELPLVTIRSVGYRLDDVVA